jgi:hypothetical protein
MIDTAQVVDMIQHSEDTQAIKNLNKTKPQNKNNEEIRIKKNYQRRN